MAASAAILAAPNAQTQGVSSQSGELRVFATRSIATVLEKIGGDFERRTGRKLRVATDVAVRMVRRIDAGEPFDITFTGGISTKSKSIDAAKDLMTALTSPAAKNVMRIQGMEPGK